MLRKIIVLPKVAWSRGMSIDMASIPKPIRSPKLPQPKLFIGNEWEDPGSNETIPVINPTNERVIGKLACAGKGDIDAAIASAVEAFKLGSTWRSMDASQRGILLNRLADLIERDATIIASLETLECGKLFKTTVKGDMKAAIAYFRYYAGYSDKNAGSQIAPNGKLIGYSRHEPVGVTGIITSWNFSTMTLAAKLAPCLAAGCTAVVKPSQHSSLAALHLGQLVMEAEFPRGVVNIVTGPGKIGAYMTEHRDIDAISFTGSTPVGRDVYRKGGGSMKRIVLELGGKSPNIILDNANIDKAVDHAYMAAFHNMGQCCCSGSRTFVHESIYDEFLEKTINRIKKRKVGDPFDLDVEHGPQTTEEQTRTVMKYIELGKEEGATLEIGGERIERPGYYVQPTLFTNVNDDMTIAKEEIFGPVMQLFKYNTINEVIDRANNTEFGLAASVFGTNIDQITTLTQAIRAGSIWVNCYFKILPQGPFGGYKMSGIGREGGRHGIEAFTEFKSVYIRADIKCS